MRPLKDKPTSTIKNPEPSNNAGATAEANKQNIISVPDIKPATDNTAPVTQTLTPARPPRLNLPATPVQRTVTHSAPKKDVIPSQESPEIIEIFEKSGYVVKNNVRINRFKPALFAIGNDEVLWIGAIDIDTTKMREMIDKLNQVFLDTLDEITININGFVINAPDQSTSEFQDILMFDSISELEKYMESHPNPSLSAEEQDNFNAYSEYIDTVIKYIGNI